MYLILGFVAGSLGMLLNKHLDVSFEEEPFTYTVVFIVVVVTIVSIAIPFLENFNA